LRRIFPVAKWRVERNAANAEREVGPPPLTLSVSVIVIECNFVQEKTNDSTIISLPYVQVCHMHTNEVTHW